MLAVSTSFPRELGPGSEVPQGRPPVPGDSGPGPRACGVDRLSRGTRARVHGHAVSTGCPGGLGPASEGPPGRPAVQVDSGPSLKARVVDQLSQALGPVSEGTWVRPGVPGDRTRVRRPLGSTICPGRYWPGSKGPRGPPAGPRDSGPVLMARGVNQQSLAPGARVRNPSVLSSCPGRLETVPEGLGVEQLCQGTHT